MTATAYQTGTDVLVAYKVEETFGTAPDASSATRFRAAAGAGLELKKATVMPTEFRTDGMTVQARLGSRSVSGEYAADLSVGTFDALFEAALRGTWVAATSLAAADMTSITVPTANTIVADTGSWITQGVLVGGVIRLPASATSTNNNRNLRVTAVTDSTITVAETLTVADSPDTSFTLDICKNLVQGLTPVSRSFTFEEYFTLIDQSQLFRGCRVIGMTLSFKPDKTVTVTFKLAGQDMDVETTDASPYFTSPTLSVSMPLVVTDGSVRVNGAPAINFTGFDLTMTIDGQGEPVIGATVSPDVFLSPAKVTGSLTGIRSDLSMLGLFSAETLFDIHILCVENMSEPKNFLAFYFGNVLTTGNTKNLGNTSALIETIPVNIGIDQAGGGHAPTMLLISTSAS